jgi:hypothetical protein
MLDGMTPPAGLTELESDVSRRRREAAFLLRVAASRCSATAAELSGRAPPAEAAAVAAEASDDLWMLSIRLRRLACQARKVPQRGTI